MAFRGGFYNSQNGDRRYYAEDFARIVSSIITDGVIKNYGKAFDIRSVGGMNIVIDTGLAWFRDSWLFNDAIIPEVIPQSDLLFTRIDSYVLEIDKTSRTNIGKWVSGTPSLNPDRPLLIDNDTMLQMAVMYVEIPANAIEITQSNISMVVGTDTPIATSILQSTDISNLYSNWSTQFNEWFADTEIHMTETLDDLQEAVDSIYSGNDSMLKSQYDLAGTGVNGMNTKYGVGIVNVESTEMHINVTLSTDIINFPENGYVIVDISDAESTNVSRDITLVKIISGGSTRDYSVINNGESSFTVYHNQSYSFILNNIGNTISFKSGGTALGYRVYGGASEPMDAKDETLWIKTDVEITGLSIESINKQLSPTNGSVWIETDSSSDIVLDVGYKHRVEIGLLKVYQFINNIWNVAEAYIKKNGLWIPFDDGFIFSHGDDKTDITGGWSSSGYKFTSWAINTVVLSNDGTRLVFNATAGRYGLAGNQKPIDFTNTKSVVIEFEVVTTPVSTQSIYLTRSKTSIGMTGVVPISLNKPAGVYTETIDVSAITGEAYIGMWSDHSPGNNNISPVYINSIKLL